MTDEKLDQILKHALTPEIDESDLRVREKDEEQTMKTKMDKGRFFRRPAVAAASIALVLVTSVSAYAAVQYLTSSQVAHELGDQTLEAAFDSPDAVTLNEAVEIDGYQINLLGIVSGEDLSDYVMEEETGELKDDRTYVVTAVSKTDGSVLGEDSLFTTPLISGYDQSELNIYTLCGGCMSYYTEDNKICYSIIDMDNVEPFADHTIYLAVLSGGLFDTDANGEAAYVYDKSTGAYSRNESFDGVNALFTLPVDETKADSDKAAEIIKSISETTTETSGETRTESEKKVDEFISKLTVENISEYAEPIEETKQTLTPDTQGMISYSYAYEAFEGSCKLPVSELFPDGATGMSGAFGCICSENGVDDMLIETFTLNDDGTVTFMLYQPKSE